MTNNLLSKIGKYALIPLTAFTLSNTDMVAQTIDTIPVKNNDSISVNKTEVLSTFSLESVRRGAADMYAFKKFMSNPKYNYRLDPEYNAILGGAYDAQYGINSPSNSKSSLDQKSVEVKPQEITKPNKIHSGFDFDFNFRLGGGKGPGGIIPYDNYEQNFLPEGGTGELTEHNGFFTEFTTLGASYKLRAGDISFGPRIGFTTSNLIVRYRSLSHVDINWWDKVKLQDIAIKKTPNVGLSIDFVDDMNDKTMNINFSVYKFKIYERHFDGLDCYGCTNTSYPFEKILLDEGLGTKLSVTMYNTGDNTINGWGVFIETNGKKVFDTKYSFAGGISYNLLLQTDRWDY